MDDVLRLIWHYYYCVLSMWGRRWGWRYCWVCVFHFGGGGSVQEVNKKKVNHFIELTHKRTKRIRMILLSEASPIFTCSPLGGRCVACVRLCVSALLWIGGKSQHMHTGHTHAHRLLSSSGFAKLPGLCPLEQGPPLCEEGVLDTLRAHRPKHWYSRQTVPVWCTQVSISMLGWVKGSLIHFVPQHCWPLKDLCLIPHIRNFQNA